MVQLRYQLLHHRYMELVQKVRRQIIYFDNFSKSRGSDISVSQVDVDLFVFWTIAAKTGINNGVIGSSVYVTAGPIRDIVQMIDPELLQVFYQIPAIRLGLFATSTGVPSGSSKSRCK